MKYALQALELSVHIGITPEEQAEPQMILCDIDFQADSEKGEDNDDVTFVINYQEVYDQVKALAHAEGKTWNLLEALHAQIIEMIEDAFPQMSHVRVALTKFPFEDGAIMISNR